MPRSDDFAIWRIISAADMHICHAHFGRYSRQAKANLYARAAGMLMTASEALMEQAEALEQNPAEAMVRKAYHGG